MMNQSSFSLPIFMLIVLFSSILSSACSPFETRTPPPPPQPLLVAYTPAMALWVDDLHQCALEHPEIGLIIQETNITNLSELESDLTLWFGEPSQEIPGYTFLLGMDHIVIIAGTRVALQNLNPQQIRNFYTTPDSPYQVWTYGEGSELRDILNRVVLEEGLTPTSAFLAPNPAAMIEAIIADPMAIGYLPESWLPDDIQKIPLEPDLKVAFTHPLLAIANEEPEGNLKAYLFCLQNTKP